ncbi:MAG: hypothetical protein QGI90_08080 [Nitrospinaceae bacterium]|jgi:hypothetical protein|nr:hypothetical protein [Nitrospinaceae bacterium]
MDVYMDWGSKEHKELLCRFFIETHKPFSPEELPWPDLDEVTVEKLTKFPIWDYAVHTERQVFNKLTGYSAGSPFLNDDVGFLVRWLVPADGYRKPWRVCFHHTD